MWKRLLSSLALLTSVALSAACTTTAPPPGAPAGDPTAAISAICAEEGADSEVCLLGSSYARGETPDVPSGSKRYRAAARSCAGLVQSECDKVVAIALEEEVRHWRRPLAEGEFTSGQLRLLEERFELAAESCLPDNRSRTAPRATTHAPAPSYRPNGEWTVESFNLTGRLATGPVPLERIPPELGWAIRQAIGCLELVAASGEFAPLDVTYADALKASGSKPVAIADSATETTVQAVDPLPIRVVVGEFTARLYGGGDRFRFGGFDVTLADGEQVTIELTGRRNQQTLSEASTLLRREGSTVRFCDPLSPANCPSSVTAPLREGDIDESRISLPVAFGGGLQTATVSVELVRGEPLRTRPYEIIRPEWEDGDWRR